MTFALVLFSVSHTHSTNESNDLLMVYQKSTQDTAISGVTKPQILDIKLSQSYRELTWHKFVEPLTLFGPIA